MAKELAFILFAFVSLFLQGCSTLIFSLPDDIGSKGLLVAQVSSRTWPHITRGYPVISSDDGKLSHDSIIGGMREGTIMVPLEPGTYTLERIEEYVDGYIATSGYGAIGQSTYRHYPINKPFTIESGKATNLGLIVFEPFIGTSAGGLKATYFDNSSEVKTFISERYPKLFASLRTPEFDYIPSPSVNDDKLLKLRRYLLAKELTYGQSKSFAGKKGLITSSVGTIGWVKQQSDGQWTVDKFVDSGTVSDLSGCGFSGLRAACVLSQKSFLLINGDKIERRDAPAGIIIDTASAFGDAGVLLVDQYMRLHISRDNGKRWSVFDGAARTSPVKRYNRMTVAQGAFEIVLAPKGYYVFLKGADGGDAPIVYGEFNGTVHRLIELPDTVEDIQKLVNLKDKLLVGPAKTAFANGKLHIFDKLQTTWSIVEIPAPGCDDMFVDRNNGAHIVVLCARGKTMVTEDGGTTWHRKTAN